MPSAAVSINRIIWEAGIPRDSFYMYFTDKEDLFRCLMEAYGEVLIQQLGERLARSGGDLFAAALALFDHVNANWHSGAFREMAAILRRGAEVRAPADSRGRQKRRHDYGSDPT